MNVKIGNWIFLEQIYRSSTDDTQQLPLTNDNVITGRSGQRGKTNGPRDRKCR